jgi:hypothetical protein
VTERGAGGRGRRLGRAQVHAKQSYSFSCNYGCVLEGEKEGEKEVINYSGDATAGLCSMAPAPFS